MDKQYNTILEEGFNSITERQKKQFSDYYEMLIEWNEKMNLTAITDKEEVYWKHFYDSLIIAKYCDLNTDIKICDIGSGAGFPIIPLKIAYPQLKVTIVDSLNKRIVFLEELVKKLELENVVLFHDRAENFGSLHREEFDVVTARAVARLNILSELCMPLVKKNGVFLVLKGADGLLEMKEATNACKKLGGELVETFEFELPYDQSKRVLHIIKKIKITPEKYPRLYSQIKKNPL